MRLGNVDLKRTVLAEGDLPAGFDLTSVSCGPPKDFSRYLPAPVQEIECELPAVGSAGGRPNALNVVILLYESTTAAEEAYRLAVEELESAAAWGTIVSEHADRGDIGERAFTTQVKTLETWPSGDSAEIGYVDIAFTRCHSLVHIRLWDPALRAEVLIAYAKRLDDRLRSLACD